MKEIKLIKKGFLLSYLLGFLSFSVPFTSVNAATLDKDLNVSAIIEKSCVLRSLRNIDFEYDANEKVDKFMNFRFNELLYIKCNNIRETNLKISGASNSARELKNNQNEILRYRLEMYDTTYDQLYILPDDTVKSAAQDEFF